MATSSLYLGSDGCDLECDVCKYQNISSEAVSYCKVCTEALCHACDKVHRASKLTRNHKMLTGDELMTVSSGSQRTPAIMMCDYHQIVIKYFCRDHNDTLCNTCKIASHAACDVIKIGTHAAKQKPSKMLGNINGQLRDLEDKMIKLKKQRNGDKATLKNNIKKCLDEINRVRKEVDEVLDNLEKNMKSEIEELEKKLANKIDEQVSTADDTINQIQESIKFLKECEKSSRDDVKCVGITKSERKIVDYRQIPSHLETTEPEVDVYWQPHDMLVTELKQLTSMGKVQSRENDERSFSCKNLSVGVRRQYDVGSTKVQSIIFLPDGNVVLACVDAGLKLMDKNFQQTSYLQMRAAFACQISAKEVLVSLGKHKQLHIVEVSPRFVIRETLDVGRPCAGLAFFDNEIYVTCHGNPGNGEVRVLNRAGQLQRRLGFDGRDYRFTFPVDVKVVRNGNAIIVTDYNEGTLTCLGQQGHVIYVVKDLEKPTGLLVEREGNILVCERHSVAVISKDGKRQRTLLTEDDEEPRPFCISYRSSDGCLAVGVGNDDNLSLCTFDTNT